MEPLYLGLSRPNIFFQVWSAPSAQLSQEMKVQDV